MTLEQQIAVVNAAGYRVNNLFQHPVAGWQANLTNGTDFWEFGHGATPAAALAEAMEKAKLPLADSLDQMMG